MSKAFGKIVIILALAGVLLMPACSNIDRNKNQSTSNESPTSSPSVTASPEDPTANAQEPTERPSQSPVPTKDTIKVITTEEELEEYFNSITDEEIEELYRIIEEIDISGDIDIDSDPGFDEIVIPDE